MFRRINSTYYMKELTEIEHLLKEGYRLVESDGYFIWFERISDRGVVIRYGVCNKYIEEGLSTYMLVLQLVEHFKRLETHNPL